MIIFALVVLLIFAGLAWWAFWLHRSYHDILRNRDEDLNALLANIGQVRALLEQKMEQVQGNVTENLAGQIRYTEQLRRDLADVLEIQAGIVQFLDDVPQNFAFHRAGIHYELQLPDRLRLALSQDLL